MDRALKERIVGAVVLVVIAVLVVPVFLDGPSGDAEIVTEPVKLPGQDEPENRRTVVLQLDRDQPLPVSSSNPEPRAAEASEGAAGPGEPPATDARAAPVTAAAQKEPAAESAPPPVREQAPPPAQKQSPQETVPVSPAADADSKSATGMWAVQIGSFSSKENADRLAAGLREKGYAAFLSQLQTGSGALHRVRIGPQKDRDSAEAVAAKLQSDNVDGQVVPHP